MRILWIKVGGLWPLDTGGRLRTFRTLRELSAAHRVTLLTTHGPADDPQRLAAELAGCEKIVSIPHDIPKQGTARFAKALAQSWLTLRPLDAVRYHVPALRREVEWRLHAAHPDVCVADFLAAVPNVPMAASGKVPTVLFSHNVEHVIWKRLCNLERRPLQRALLEAEWRRVRHWETRACRRARLTLTVSEEDRDTLLEAAPDARVAAVPTGVDTSYFCPNGPPRHRRALVFTGSMDWVPNEDAVLHFIEAILPRVRMRESAASLAVVGRNPTARLRAAAAAAGVRVSGTVEDVRPYVRDAAVFVVPLRIGGGTRLKIFEALAMGKAVVSTRVGAEGLPLKPGEHFLEADAPDDFADAVVALMRDPDRRDALGRAGRQLVEEKYAWPQVARVFADKLEEVAHAR